MKNNYKHIYVLAAFAIMSLLQSCRQQEICLDGASSMEQDTSSDTSLMKEDTCFAQVALMEFNDQARIRHPDKKVKAKKGHALYMETEGFSLTATDSAVIRNEIYSVTSLYDDELPLVPQEMVNMTECAAGYRLLPGGEHFRPFAELRIKYDPARLPFGYTADDIYTSYYDTTTHAWVRLERVAIDTVEHEIVSLTTHFTDFINEILQAPEMPETQAFVPTQISGLEAANPMSGYTTIAPPEANNMGTATLSYPFHVPAGRGGVQPNVALNYNSNGGNGVCGMGWDFSVPSISVETRWGVPLYDNNSETETYLFNGEQLLVSYDNLPTFAKESGPRISDIYTKRFYPRVEGSFDSILRHGTTPQTYWWEVFDRSGTQYIYGLGDGELRSQQKNAIARWYLTRVIDRNGNTARYHYKEDINSGIYNTSGTAIYLDKITYSSPSNGFPENPWYGYCVTFHYGERTDFVVSGNYGVKENISRRLDSVKTWFVKNEPQPIMNSDTFLSQTGLSVKLQQYQQDIKKAKPDDTIERDKLDRIVSWLLKADTVHQTNWSLVRGYRLLYSYSQTGKSLLDAVVEMNPDEWDDYALKVSANDFEEDNATLKYHRFSYHGFDRPSFGEEYKLMTNVSEAYSGLPEFYPSPLGGSREWKSGFNFSAGVGLGLKTWLRTVNGEVNGSISPKSTSHGTTTLLDINGDGYPDLLYKKRDGSWMCQLYRPNSTDPSNPGVLGTPITANIPPNDYSSTITKNNFSVGLSIHAGVEYYNTSTGVNAGVQYSHSNSDNTTYFTDVNADGLPDIVDNGRVWYNNSHGNNVEYDTIYQIYHEGNTSCEPNYYSLDGAEKMDDSIFTEGHISETYVSYFDENGGNVNTDTVSDTLVVESPDTIFRSAVRVWVAQYNDSILISGNARLDSRFITAIERTNADGVHVSIQCNDSILPNTEHDLDASHSSCTFFEKLFVEKGDCIYFRVESLKNDLYDVVDWSPVICYFNQVSLHPDSVNRKKYVFSAEDDFLAWQNEQFVMPKNGTVHIDANYSIPSSMTDTVQLQVLHKKFCSNPDSTNWDTIVMIPKNTIVNNGSLAFDRKMDSSDVLIFKATSKMDVDWTILQWHPHVVCNKNNDTDFPCYSVVYDENGMEDTVFAIEMYPSPEYSCGWDSVPENLSQVLRSTYRGWGCFTYNSDTLRAPIDTSKIHPNDKISLFNDMTDSSILTFFGDTNHVSTESIQSCMTEYVPNSEGTGTATMNATFDIQNSKRIWTANGYRSFITPTQMGLFNWRNVCAMLADTVLLYPVTNKSIGTSGKKAVGPVKGSAQNGFSVHVSLSAGVDDAEECDDFSSLGISACTNYSHGVNRLTAEFVDMNGDGYPDIVGENDVQYTNSRGGLSSKHAGTVLTGIRGIQHTVYDAFSLQGGMSYASYEKRGKSKGEVHIVQRSKGSGLSGSSSLAKSFDHLSLAWMDMNGDGLPDCVCDKNVYLNLGYDYYGSVYMDENPLPKNNSENRAISKGVDFSSATHLGELLANSLVSGINQSFSAGKSISESDNNGTVLYADINGDGLVDKIVGKDVYFNKGWGFVSDSYGLNHPVESKSIGRNIDYNGNITAGVPITLKLKLQGSAGVSIGNSISTTEALLMDMNADGLPDLVSRNDSIIRVRYNQMYDVDKLVSVKSFYGNYMEMEYAQAPYSSRSRQRPTVMSSLTVSDSTLTSSDHRHFSFEYYGYAHSVAERTPYGFDSVVVKRQAEEHLYRVISRKYHTDHYKMRGRKYKELLADSNGSPLVEKLWNYELIQISDGNPVPVIMDNCFEPTWPALVSTATRHYDQYGHIMIETAENYNYTGYGRVAEYINRGNIATADDDVHCSVNYSRAPHNQSALPKTMTVFDSQNHMLRCRTANYNNRGLLSKLVIYNNDNDTATQSIYTYDEYGNPLSVVLPPNDSSQRPHYLYTYDTLMHQFLTSTTDSAFGVTSRAEYDVRLGVPLHVYSVGGDSISYSYDGWGRMLTIRAPQESDTNGYPTIRYRYWDDAGPAQQVNLPDFRSFTSSPAVVGVLPETQCHNYGGWPIWAQTLHRSQKDAALNVTTALFTDGHGRVLQTRKTAVIDGYDKQVASGHVIYDDAGRPTRAYEPFVVSTTSFCNYAVPIDTGLFTRTFYDVLDRTVRTEIPSQSIVTTVDHGFRSESGVNYFKTVTTDPENNSSTVLTDARELTVKSIDAMGGVTRLEYDAMGQLTHSYDPDNFLTSYQYDMQGNLTQRIHPDAGTTMYEYDPAGHLTRETNPLGQIFYHYTYYRLAHKRYSDMTENNVTYSYGDVGRATGRPVRIVDGSGVQTFEYDALGNVSKSIRVLSVPASGYAYAFTHNFEYDSWGRIWSMTYPDGERVDYRYNHAGDLTLMTGDKWGNPRTYIADILYTKYGQRKRIDYGNGTHTEYAYDSLQRLAFLHSEDISHNPMQHTEYSYNKVGNITGMANNAGGIGGMGGLYSNSYYYDPLGRLVASNGSGDIGGQPRDYAMEEMQYSPSGRIGTKHLLWQSVTTRGIQHMEYFYSNSNDKPHAPRLIVNNATGGLYDLVWDGAGNLVRMAVRNEPAVDYSNRILHWTEDNRLFAVADESHFSYYAYDHNGERTLKMTGDAATVDQNALEQHVFTSLNHVTLYPSPYIVLTEQGYTKHYYAGADRLAARLGSGGLSRDTSCVRSNENLVRRTDELFRHSCERVNSFNYRNHEEQELVRIDGSIFDSVFEFDRNAASRHLYADVKPRPGAIHNLIVSHSTHNTRSAPTPEEPDVYFYHSDHLGSASWITNAAGMPIQHLQYLPFGERFVDQRSTGYSERFTFTGKERDEETGYGYFGARYMDHELMTMWLSVDPMADKYPGISPYNYCAWNPIILVDPDGRDTSYYNLDGRQQFVKKGGSDINMMIVTRKNVDEESFDKGGYYAFDVNEIDFEKMDNMYKSSEVKGADEWYYRVRKDGTSTEPEKLGPHGGKVQFAEDDKFNVHTHTLDNAMEINRSNLDPSMDKDCVGIGDRFGIILGYSKKNETSAGASFSNGNTANRDGFKQSVSFYDRNGKIELGDNCPTYNNFKKAVRKLQTR